MAACRNRLIFSSIMHVFRITLTLLTSILAFQRTTLLPLVQHKVISPFCSDCQQVSAKSRKKQNGSLHHSSRYVYPCAKIWSVPVLYIKVVKPKAV